MVRWDLSCHPHLLGWILLEEEVPDALGVGDQVGGPVQDTHIETKLRPVLLTQAGLGTRGLVNPGQTSLTSKAIELPLLQVHEPVVNGSRALVDFCIISLTLRRRIVAGEDDYLTRKGFCPTSREKRSTRCAGP